MGWSFRRAKKVGPFRFTLSKSGVGMSAGVKGARVGIGADGRTHASVGIPGTGISYQMTGSSGHGGYTAPASQAYAQPGARLPSGTSTMGPLFLLGAVGSTFWAAYCFANSEAGAGLVLGVLAVGLVVGAVALIMRAKRIAAHAAADQQRAYWEWTEQQRVYAAQQQAYAGQQARQRAELEEQQRRERYVRLVSTYGEEGAESIVHGKLWIGAPEAAALEIYGTPDDVEERVLKTKTKRILKYRDVLKSNRYQVKVTIEKGAVVGWEDKG